MKKAKTNKLMPTRFIMPIVSMVIYMGYSLCGILFANDLWFESLPAFLTTMILVEEIVQRAFKFDRTIDIYLEKINKN